MLILEIKTLLLTAVLVVSSLVFAEEVVVSALVLITISLTAVLLVIGPEGGDERFGGGSPNEAEDG